MEEQRLQLACQQAAAAAAQRGEGDPRHPSPRRSPLQARCFPHTLCLRPRPRCTRLRPAPRSAISDSLRSLMICSPRPPAAWIVQKVLVSQSQSRGRGTASLCGLAPLLQDIRWLQSGGDGACRPAASAHSQPQCTGNPAGLSSCARAFRCCLWGFVDVLSLVRVQTSEKAI